LTFPYSLKSRHIEVIAAFRYNTRLMGLIEILGLKAPVRAIGFLREEYRKSVPQRPKPQLTPEEARKKALKINAVRALVGLGIAWASCNVGAQLYFIDTIAGLRGERSGDHNLVDIFATQAEIFRTSGFHKQQSLATPTPLSPWEIKATIGAAATDVALGTPVFRQP